jgi:acyl dehydratase
LKEGFCGLVGNLSDEQEVDVEITAELIAAYAAAVGEGATGLDEGAAAPPMFAAVYAAAAIWRALVATVEGGGPLVHAAQEFEWFAPVRAGDRIATRARLDDVSTVGAHRSLRFRSVSRNERDELVSRGLWTIVVPEGGL